MDPKPLPPRPNLEQYRKQAKELLKACHSADAEAIKRVRESHPGFSNLSETEFQQAKISLADAQLVIAREHGFDGWSKFARRVELLSSERDEHSGEDPLAGFIEAAIWHGTLERAEAILSAHPGIAQTSIHAAAILGDDEAVHRLISLDPHSATRKEEPYGGDALVYLCLSKYLRRDKSRSQNFLRAARALLDAGANPNTGFWSMDEYPDFETALYGAAGVAHHAELTRLLLERGGDPNDVETAYHSPENYDNSALHVLVESGKLTADSLTMMLIRKADIHDYEGMKYLLEHGADPNRNSRWDITGLHQTLRRDNRLEHIEVMLDHAADPNVHSNLEGRSGISLAARRGRGDVLQAIQRHGIPLILSGVDKLIAACAMNDVATIRSICADEPQLAMEVRKLGGKLLAEFAGNANSEGVQHLLDLGIPVDALYEGDPYFDIAKDSTALHVAAWKGWPKAVKLLLERGAPVNAEDSKGRTPLMLAIKACVDSHWINRRSPESVEALLQAGATLKGVDFPSGYEEVDDLLAMHAI